MTKSRTRRNNRKKQAAKHQKNKAKKPKQVRESWVDNVRFVSVNGDHDEPKNDNDQQTTLDSDEIIQNDDEASESSTEMEGAGEDAAATNNNNNNNGQSSNKKKTISLISWNVLAESYCSPKSHQRLPPSYRTVVFQAPRRRKRILQVLQHLISAINDHNHDDDNSNSNSSGILCLQEVDLPEIKQQLEEQCGYVGIETPRVANGGATGGRADSCGIYVSKDDFDILDTKLLALDDLATYSSSIKDPQKNVSKQQQTSPAIGSSNWQGLQHSLLRRNAALLVRLRHKSTGRTLVVANSHLFWNPGYEYVKLCQAHYILIQARQSFVHEDEPLIFSGDLNSRPHGCTHSYLTQGFLNAKLVAPWYAYHHYNRDKDNINYRVQFGKEKPPPLKEKENNPVDTTTETEKGTSTLMKSSNPTSTLTNQLSSLSLNDETRTLGPVRYILDATLNKLCRWLRIMGIDTVLETEEEEQERTKHSNFVLFDRCRKEQRTLITTSTRLMARRECPAGAYCINPVFLPSLEVAMIHILLTHGVELEPENFLTRCVVCNGDICPVEETKEKQRILASYEAPVEQCHKMNVYECNGCQQGYWWDDRPNSSASRVKSTATRLFKQCLRAGVPIKESSKTLGMFEGHVSVEEERKRGWDRSEPGSALLDQQLDIVDWLKDENLECPFQFTSAYSSGNEEFDEILPFSNVTFYFVSTLDYIFYETSKLQLESRLYVPKSFADLNDEKIDQGHLLPSDVWPSDHLAVGARFSFPSDERTKASTQSSREKEKMLDHGKAVTKSAETSEEDDDEQQALRKFLSLPSTTSNFAMPSIATTATSSGHTHNARDHHHHSHDHTHDHNHRPGDNVGETFDNGKDDEEEQKALRSFLSSPVTSNRFGTLSTAASIHLTGGNGGLSSTLPVAKAPPQSNKDQATADSSKGDEEQQKALRSFLSLPSTTHKMGVSTATTITTTPAASGQSHSEGHDHDHDHVHNHSYLGEEERIVNKTGGSAAFCPTATPKPVSAPVISGVQCICPDPDLNCKRCIPPVPSMFEMAERRKQLRLQREREKKAAGGR